MTQFQKHVNAQMVIANGHEPKPKKPEWNIDKEIKQEIEDNATQNIEEFHTQDLNFDDDFSSHATPVAEVKQEISNASNAITDVAEEFLNEEFDIFPAVKKESPKELRTLPTTWTQQVQENVPSIQTDGQLPLQSNSNGEKVFKFYWLDAWEDRYIKPGVVYLFGKTYVNPSNRQAGCVSCCLVVKNVNRQMYLLPREYVCIPLT